MIQSCHFSNSFLTSCYRRPKPLITLRVSTHDRKGFLDRGERSNEETPN